MASIWTYTGLPTSSQIIESRPDPRFTKSHQTDDDDLKKT